ncbi:methionine ABC transporter ATP-binding protein [Jonesia quinghaiensis]|uniref:methionine ABC transporter ATP-binding protein n=1 Tax=Jonesia quinghaiensis TaxID=262806 RepID=UPI0004037CF9|nr:methionine ABC transporter ATP-binding protein [Jonesia quinghaiensis]
MSNSAPIVEFINAEKHFIAKKNTVKAVDDVTLTVNTGEVFGVIGYSGAGKSTLVRMVNALEPATGGKVIVNGHDVSSLKESALRTLRLEIGMIFQQFNLLQSRTVAANVAYPLEVAGVDRTERRRRVAELLEFVGLSDKAKAFPSQLSGGQKQRVGIARALATSPKILLADEATSALDPETTADVLGLLRRVNEELGITVIVITHEMEVVKAICDRVAVMEHGKVVELGDVYQVFSHPGHRATRRFVSSAIKDRPDPDVLARLRHRHKEHLITVYVHEDGGQGERITDLLNRHGVRGGIIYGGISEVKERPFGSLTWGLDGEPDAIARFITELGTYTHVVDLGTADAPLDGFGHADLTDVVEEGK